MSIIFKMAIGYFIIKLLNNLPIIIHTFIWEINIKYENYKRSQLEKKKRKERDPWNIEL